MLYLLLRALFDVARTHRKALVTMLLLAVLGLGGRYIYRLQHPRATVQVVAPGVTAVQVETDALTTKEVIQYLPDPKDKALIVALQAQLAALKARTTGVIVTTAASESTGGGRVTENRVISTPPAEVAVTFPAEPAQAQPQPAVTGVHFRDYRLTFDANLITEQATYKLTQRFESVVMTGRQANGKPLALAQLYELAENGDRTLLPTVATTAVFADETAPHWYRGLGIQAGIAATIDAAGTATTPATVALQWLSHGRTKAAEDTSYTVLAPAVVFGRGVQDIGIIPVAFNFGRLPHQPFSNVWGGIFISKSQRVGVTFTAKF